MIFIFLDGVGIGKKSEHNPFYVSNTEYLPFFEQDNVLHDGTPIKPIDARMGVDGIPQSATGQTTIYTGTNIPKLLNSHIGSFPNKHMRALIKKSNIFKQLREKGLSTMFLNTYPRHSNLFYKTNVDIDGNFIFSKDFPSKYKKKISVTSCLLITNKIKPFDISDLLDKNSIYQDYSNKSLIKLGIKCLEYSPETAAEIMYNSSKKYDFLLYEYFQTDIYGHRKTIDECNILVKNLNRLIKKLISLLEKKQDTLLITSDHGNLEELSNKKHTLNPVPLITWGYKDKYLRDKINNLADITPAICDYFKK